MLAFEQLTSFVNLISQDIFVLPLVSASFFLTDINRSRNKTVQFADAVLECASCNLKFPLSRFRHTKASVLHLSLFPNCPFIRCDGDLSDSLDEVSSPVLQTASGGTFAHLTPSGSVYDPTLLEQSNIEEDNGPPQPNTCENIGNNNNSGNSKDDNSNRRLVLT